jgi:hypothetical protein
VVACDNVEVVGFGAAVGVEDLASGRVDFTSFIRGLVVELVPLVRSLSAFAAASLGFAFAHWSIADPVGFGAVVAGFAAGVVGFETVVAAGVAGLVGAVGLGVVGLGVAVFASLEFFAAFASL